MECGVPEATRNKLGDNHEECGDISPEDSWRDGNRGGEG